MIEDIKKILDKYLTEKNIYNSDKKYTIEMCKNIKHGNFATNIVMIYGKDHKQEMANEVINLLKNIEYIDDVSYVNPGFINMNINSNIIKNLDIYWSNVTGKKPINISVEYASPNPTGPCHIGHARGSIIGDIIASILIYLGYNVRKDCIFNDGGKQVDKLIESIYIRYKELNKMATDEDLVNIFYKGDYIKDIAAIYNTNNNLTLNNFLIIRFYYGRDEGKNDRRFRFN